MSSCCLSPRGVSPSGCGARGRSGPCRVRPAVRTRPAYHVRGGRRVGGEPRPSATVYLDLPTKDGKPQTRACIARFAANAPHAMLPQYVHGPEALSSAIALDVGLQDFLLQDSVDDGPACSPPFGIPAQRTMTYGGDHANRVGARFEEHVLPFFSEQLKEVARRGVMPGFCPGTAARRHGSDAARSRTGLRRCTSRSLLRGPRWPQGRRTSSRPAQNEAFTHATYVVTLAASRARSSSAQRSSSMQRSLAASPMRTMLTCSGPEPRCRSKWRRQ